MKCLDCNLDKRLEGKRCVSCRNRRFKNRHPLYDIYSGMKARCYNNSSPFYYRYGGRGITICKRWQASYDNFVEDMGERLVGYSLERIDNNGNYEPSNCRWATSKEQCNNRSDNKKYIYKDKSLTLPELSQITGVKYATLRKRLITLGWDISTATDRPVRQWKIT